MLPLTGITVVALEQAVAAPFATRQLADLGARVLKVERPGVGDFARGYDETVEGMSSYFVWLNRGKESVALDIKDPDDRAVLDAMLAEADVFVQNLLPGATARLGLDQETLRDRHPRLITCSISGYGSDGPYRSKKAYDLLVQCEAGFLSVTGTPGSPAKAGASVADISAGMYAFTGVLTALYERERTGAGTSFEVAMLDALGEWMGQPYFYARYGGSPPPRTGARHASIAPYGPYRAGGGAQVFIGVQNEREWAALCTDVLARPDLAEDPRFVRNSRRVANNRRAQYAARGGAGAADRRPGHRAPRRGGHRKRTPADDGRVRRAPPARSPRSLAGCRLPGRPTPFTPPAGHRPRTGVRHGAGAGHRATH
ncbi:Crotonobetainyl-CoA:carnitine CoA-transferase CaiB [Modestobacter sp. DSM 44400]|nr:CaiB/BaiF CoA-transferase family protein [Modestobacter sp. DSM 44400]SDY11252.1 Crotonobetainyl-CoA:carnitine CoA-transferase CaiB [Modestobacter sp. DSM 44400]